MQELSSVTISPAPEISRPRSVQIPSVEVLQSFEDNRDAHESRALFALAGNPVATRPLNLLRAQLLKRAEKNNFRLIGVTSAAPGAGKSFVTCNLAASLSRITDQEVYLFDFDLRRPSVATYFGLEPEQGINAWLAGTLDDLRPIGKRLGQSRLSIYPTLRHHEGASEFFAGPRFEILVAALRALSEKAIILCDLPPAFVSDDALTVIGLLDAYIHVMEEGITPARQVEELKKLMDPAPCLGGVLNRYAGSWNDSYGYAALRKYSQYYRNEE